MLSYLHDSCCTALLQVDPSVTETEFTRRRLEGGTLYALLSEESSNYLHVGPFTDADMELLGTSFAEVRFRHFVIEKSLYGVN